MKSLSATPPFLLLLFLPLISVSQLSSKLLKFLPDSCRPVPNTKKYFTATEIARLFKYAEDFSTPAIYRELDSLAEQVFSYSLSQKNEDSCIKILYRLTRYSATVENYQACSKYCDAVLQKMKGNANYKAETSICIMIKGGNYSRLGNYEESVRYLSFCIDSAKAIHDSLTVAECYNALTTPYRILHLLSLAFASCDSSISYFKNADSTHQEGLEDILSAKYFISLLLYDTTGNNRYIEIAQQLAADAGKRKNTKAQFIFASTDIAFYKTEYKKVIILCDSLLADIKLINALGQTYNINYLKAVKGKALIKLGKNKEGIALLSQVLSLYVFSPNKSAYSYSPLYWYSKYLYQAYKNEKNWKQALFYSDMYTAYGDSLNLTGNRGALFIAEQKYNYVKKEAEVKALQSDAIIRREQRNFAVAIIAISILCLLVLAIIAFNRYRKLQLKKQMIENEAALKIDKLQISTQLQIAELEEKSRLIKQEEQKRMGMDLHDNLGGTIAAIALNLKGKMRMTKDEALKDWLKDMYVLITEAYNETRNKSHEWYNVVNEQASSTYTNRITALLETGLPDEYEKEVLIDNETLNAAPLNTKIELLYIIKEAVANIIKHAEARKISILIYEEIHGTILSVTDDGKGFKQVNNTIGMGLTSIKTRAAGIGAEADFYNRQNRYRNKNHDP